MDVQRESLGPAIDLRPGYETFWTYIPHFIHSPFYVYAYAFGDCLVNSLYAVYEKAQRWLCRALSRRCSRPAAPSITPSCSSRSVSTRRDPAFWQGGLGVIERMIGELESLDAAT